MVVGEGQRTVGCGGLEVDTKGQQRLAAQFHVGWEVFDGSCQMVGMLQRQQKFAAAGIHIQNPAIGPQCSQNFGFIIPGEIVFVLPPTVQMGKIPAVDVGNGLFRQPLFSQFF